jgi:hypothetical protein
MIDLLEAMMKLISFPVGLGLILIGLLVQIIGAPIVGALRVGFILESLGNRLAEPDILP